MLSLTKFNLAVLSSFPSQAPSVEVDPSVKKKITGGKLFLSKGQPLHLLFLLLRF